jgi:Aspartyl protease
MIRHLSFVVALTAVLASADAVGSPLSVSFDFSRQAIGLDVTVKGTPLHVMLDTGLNPSGIDLKRAQSLGLPIDRKAAGEGNGEGGGSAKVFPSTIRDLKIGNRAFGNVQALAFDMAPISKTYGRTLDGILGYSFLRDKTVLIDYPARIVTFASTERDIAPSLARCRTHFTAPLRLLGNEGFPLVPDFRLGNLTVPATLDTGSNRIASLYPGALAMKGVREKLEITGKSGGASVGGNFTGQSAILHLAIGIGPFALPAGATVAILKTDDRATDRVANIGNATYAAMKVKILLDYVEKSVSFYGDCAT